MQLAALLGHHRGALRASLLQTYGILLEDHGQPGARDLADLVDAIPSGSAVWVSYGGPRAWAEDVAAMMVLEFRLRILAWQKTEDGRAGRNRPEPTQPPQYAAKARADDARTARRVDRYLRRTAESI